MCRAVRLANPLGACVAEFLKRVGTTKVAGPLVIDKTDPEADTRTSFALGDFCCGCTMSVGILIHGGARAMRSMSAEAEAARTEKVLEVAVDAGFTGVLEQFMGVSAVKRWSRRSIDGVFHSV